MTKDTEQHSSETPRQETYSDKTHSKTWLEVASESNAYVASDIYLHGYDHLQLVKNRRFADVFFLLFRGELPSNEQSLLLEKLLIGFMAQGPRTPATRSAILAAVSKTESALLLPLSMSINSGEHGFAGEVSLAMKSLFRLKRKTPKAAAEEALTNAKAPSGFGSFYGSSEEWLAKLATELAAHTESDSCLQWGCDFVSDVNAKGIGWLPSGLFAAALCDLGFPAKSGALLFQVASAPALAAHASEHQNRSLLSIPFVDDDDYHIEHP